MRADVLPGGAKADAKSNKFRNYPWWLAHSPVKRTRDSKYSTHTHRREYTRAPMSSQFEANLFQRCDGRDYEFTRISGQREISACARPRIACCQHRCKIPASRAIYAIHTRAHRESSRAINAQLEIAVSVVRIPQESKLKACRYNGYNDNKDVNKK